MCSLRNAASRFKNRYKNLFYRLKSISMMASKIQGMKNITNCRHGQVKMWNVTSPIGKIYVCACPNGVHALGQAEDVSDENFVVDERSAVTICTESPPDATYKEAANCVYWIQQYFQNPAYIRNMELPKICKPMGAKEGTFRERVWLTLAEKVGPGETISYGALAELVGSAGAAQAVGSAMANNPIQLLIPCHRVILSNGAPGQYAKGFRNRVKTWLLNFESRGQNGIATM